MRKQILSIVENAKSPGDLYDFGIDIKEIKNDLFISIILGFINGLETELLTDGIEFEGEFDPFSVTAEEALRIFLERHEEVEEFTSYAWELVDNSIYYIKAITDSTSQANIHSSLSDALENGMTFEEWKEHAVDYINGADLTVIKSPQVASWYWELVYRQNMMTAYAAGQEEYLLARAEYKPYAFYAGIEDSRQTDICESLDWVVKLVDDPFWDIYTPPNHFACRSSKIAMNKDDLEEYGLSVTIGIEGIESPQEGFKHKPFSQESLDNLLQEKVNKAEEELQKLKDVTS